MNRLQYAVVTLSVWLFVVSAVPLGILPDVQHAAPSPGMYASTFYSRKIIYCTIFKSLKFPKIKFVFIWSFLSAILEIFSSLKMIIHAI